jgi:hypothetical protein
MVQDDFLQLHDRATRGEELSSDEQKLLEVWYSAQDLAEIEVLGLATKEETAADSPQPQVDSALAQLTIVSGRINTLGSDDPDNLIYCCARGSPFPHPVSGSVGIDCSTA